MSETHDPLQLGVKKARGCAQRFRQLARREIEFGDLDAALQSGSGCKGRGCDQCVEAALRLVDLTAWTIGPEQAHELATWVEQYVDNMPADYRLRAKTLIAALLRYTDVELAALRWEATLPLLAEASPPERAHHWAHAAAILTDAFRIEEAREAVVRCRELYRQGCPADPERGPSWVGIADTFVEAGAIYTGLQPQLDSINGALEGLSEIDQETAPRSHQALTVNLLTLIVAAWLSGIEGIDPQAVLSQLEKSFDFNSRRSDPAATSMRWLWVVVVARMEGLSQTVRNRLRHVRSGLIAQRRWRHLLYLELDVLWATCYYRRQPQRRYLLSQVKGIRRALMKLGEGGSMVDAFERAVSGGSYVTREVLGPLFTLRGLKRVEVRDIRLD